MQAPDPTTPSSATPALGGFARHAQAGLLAELSALLPQMKDWAAGGAGGMGMVFSAWHGDLDRQVAVKVVAADGPTDAEAYARFRNEAIALGRLKHPGIVTIHDYDAVGDLAWIIMDWIDGTPLHTWWRAGSRTVRDAAAMVARIAAAAGAAHEAGVVHRDLKPGNVMVRKGGEEEPVLIDFGLAVLAGAVNRTRLTRSSIVAGTVEYLAPEQLDRQLGPTGPQADVYACGLILWELITGHPLREGEASTILAQVQRQEPPPALPKGTPADLAAICHKCLAANPRARYPDGLALASDLERYLAGKTVTARLPGPGERLLRRLRRRPVHVAAVAAVVSLGLAALSFQKSEKEQHRSRLVASLNRSLASPPRNVGQLVALLDQISELRNVAPAQATALQTGIARVLGDQLERELSNPLPLSSERLGELKGMIGRFARLDERVSARLENARQTRMAGWEEIGHVNPPYGKDERSRFFSNVKVHEAACPGRPGWFALRVDGPPHGRPPRLGPEAPPGHHVHFRTTWALPLEGACTFGINVDNAEIVGSELEICHASLLPEPAGDQPRPPPPQEPGPHWAIVHRREDKILHFRWLAASETAGGTVELAQKLEGPLTTLEINGTPFVREQDWFRWGGLRQPAQFLLPCRGQAYLISAHISTRPGLVGALAAADVLFQQGSLEAAAQAYRARQTDATSGPQTLDEARYKEAICHLELGRYPQAEPLLSQVATHGHPPWRALAAVELWRAKTGEGDIAGSIPWMHTVRDAMAASASEGWPFILPRPAVLALGHACRQELRGLACLNHTSRRAERVQEMAEALRVLGRSKASVARLAAPALYFAGQEESSRHLLLSALVQLDPLHLQTRDRETAAECLDLLMMLEPVRRDHRTTQLLSAWQHADFKPGELGWAVYTLEQARTARERDRFTEVVEMASAVLHHPQVAVATRAEAGLVLALTHRRKGDTPATREALQATGRLLDRDQSGNDLRTLFYEPIVQAMSGQWSQPSANDWLTTLMLESSPLGHPPPACTPVVMSDAARTVRMAFLRSGTDPAFARAVVSLVFRRTLPRNSSEALFHCFCQHWLLEGSVPLPPTPHQLRLIDETSTLLWKALSDGSLNQEGLFKLFAEWAGKNPTFDWENDTRGLSEDLRARLAWIFHWRFRHLDNAERLRPYEKLTKKYASRFQAKGS